MGPKRLADILNQVGDLHRLLSERYAELSAEAAHEDVKLLLAHLCRIEQYMEHCLQEYQRGADKVVLESWFRVPRISILPGFSTVSGFDPRRRAMTS